MPKKYISFNDGNRDSREDAVSFAPPALSHYNNLKRKDTEPGKAVSRWPPDRSGYEELYTAVFTFKRLH